MAYQISKTKAGLNKGPRQEAVRVAKVHRFPDGGAILHYYYMAKSVFAIENTQSGLRGRITHKNRQLWVKWDPDEAEWFIFREHYLPHELPSGTKLASFER